MGLWMKGNDPLCPSDISPKYDEKIWDAEWQSGVGFGGEPTSENAKRDCR